MPDSNNKKSLGIIAVLAVVLFAVACLALTLVMPWAELGMPDTNLPAALKGLSGFYEAVRGVLPKLMANVGGDPNFRYYVYSCFLALAMVAAAIALCIVGRDDTADQKTVLPVKK